MLLNINALGVDAILSCCPYNPRDKCIGCSSHICICSNRCDTNATKFQEQTFAISVLANCIACLLPTCKRNNSNLCIRNEFLNLDIIALCNLNSTIRKTRA